MVNGQIINILFHRATKVCLEHCTTNADCGMEEQCFTHGECQSGCQEAHHCSTNSKCFQEQCLDQCAPEGICNQGYYCEKYSNVMNSFSTKCASYKNVEIAGN